MGNNLPVIDADALAILKSVGRGEALYLRVVNLFLTTVPDSLARIDALRHDTDDLALADAVHALKSICISIGARKAQFACHELEMLLRSAEPFDVAAKVAAIAGEATAALKEIEKLRAA
jgi:HPt (histidine-containing phosphotransfer) domain-containing protein